MADDLVKHLPRLLWRRPAESRRLPGRPRAIHVYNVITASTPVILLCAVV
jgi:hypothetical protein